ncbi:MAG: FtsX-like permease family protein [Litorilituus sp.]|jgi:putative ABC transport system permease protein|nr:FtsX-like permease family protein [Litorilituus sp.]
MIKLIPNWAKQSFRLFSHELKRGDLTIIILAIVLGVASVFALSGFSEKIKQALITQSSSFIAADRVLQSSRPLPHHHLNSLPNEEKPTLTRQYLNQQSTKLNLEQAQQVIMSSMVFSGDKMQLVELVAVSKHYPLRGELLITNATSQNQQIAHAPELGTVFMERKLLTLLGIKLGGSIEIGNSTLRVTAVADQIPDASFSVFTSGAKIIMNINDLAKTQLVQPGSRVTYKYLFAGDHNAINLFDDLVSSKVNDAQRWYDIQSNQTPLAKALNRAEKYLSLASLLGIILAAVAVAIASRRFTQKHRSSVAVYKAMGAPITYIRKLYSLHWASLSLFSISVGLILGYVLAQVGLFAIKGYLPVQAQEVLSGSFSTDIGLFSLGYQPVLMAVVTGLLCALAFSVVPLANLVATAPIITLRGPQPIDEQVSFINKVSKGAIPLFALLLLLTLFSKDLILSLRLLVAGFIASLVLFSIGQVLMSFSRTIGTKSGAAWLLAMANLKRRAKGNSVQLVSFTIAIKLLLMVVVLKSALLNEWQEQLPLQTPNFFLVNIAQEYVEQLDKFIEEHHIVASDLYAVVRGRLTAINSDKITKKVTKEQNNGTDNGRQGLGRELNLTWRTSLPKENSISQGQWWSKESTMAQVSIEESLAKRLQINLGDNLTFQLGSNQVKVPVTSIRTVNWQSMQPNFYMIFSPEVLADFPVSYIASLYVEQDKKLLIQRFLTHYPTISLIDIDAMITQLRKVIDQVSKAVAFVLALVVMAGCLVLVAQVQASLEEREREIAILRTLGAKGRLLRNSVLFEFAALGAIAGLIASVSMELTVYLLQSSVFKMQTSFHFDFWVLGIVSGASFVGMVGLLSCWRLINLPSVTLIRRTM